MEHNNQCTKTHYKHRQNWENPEKLRWFQSKYTEDYIPFLGIDQGKKNPNGGVCKTKKMENT